MATGMIWLEMNVHPNNSIARIPLTLRCTHKEMWALWETVQYVYHHCIFFYVFMFVFTLVLFVCCFCPLRASVFFVAYRIYRETEKIHSSLYLFWYLHLIPLNSLFYKAHVCGCFLSGLWLYIHTGFRTPTTTPQKRPLSLALPSKQAGWGSPNNDIFIWTLICKENSHGHPRVSALIWW